MRQVIEDEIESLAKVLCAADDTRPARLAKDKPTWRDYRGMATAVKAYEAVAAAIAGRYELAYLEYRQIRGHAWIATEYA